MYESSACSTTNPKPRESIPECWSVQANPANHLGALHVYDAEHSNFQI